MYYWHDALFQWPFTEEYWGIISGTAAASLSASAAYLSLVSAQGLHPSAWFPRILWSFCWRLVLSILHRKYELSLPTNRSCFNIMFGQTEIKHQPSTHMSRGWVNADLPHPPTLDNQYVPVILANQIPLAYFPIEIPLAWQKNGNTTGFFLYFHICSPHLLHGSAVYPGRPTALSIASRSERLSFSSPTEAPSMNIFENKTYGNGSK